MRLGRAAHHMNKFPTKLKRRSCLRITAAVVGTLSSALSRRLTPVEAIICKLHESPASDLSIWISDCSPVPRKHKKTTQPRCNYEQQLLVGLSNAMLSKRLSCHRPLKFAIRIDYFAPKQRANLFKVKQEINLRVITEPRSIVNGPNNDKSKPRPALFPLKFLYL